MSDTAKFVVLTLTNGRRKIINRQHIKSVNEDEQGVVVLSTVGKSWDYCRVKSTLNQMAEVLKSQYVSSDEEREIDGDS